MSDKEKDELHLKSIASILSFALAVIEDNYHFYKSWADKISRPSLKEALNELAKEELHHKTILLSVEHDREFEDLAEKVVDLKLSDYFVHTKPHEDMTYQEALQIALQRESAAIETYRYLRDICKSPKVRAIFQALADDALHHKHELEKQYADKYMGEN